MNTTFIGAALKNMDPQLVRACALWAAARTLEHDLPDYKFEVALEFAIESLAARQSASAYSIEAALDERCPSGVRAAIFCLFTENFRLQAYHALSELAKQQGLHFVNNMLSDLMESNTSPLEQAA